MALLGFGGIGVDVGYWEYRQQAQQSATDAAAMGAAQQLLHAGCPNSSAATNAADTDAASNGFSTANVTVTVQNPPASGPFASNNCAVFVKIASTQAPFFARLFGYAGGMSETTQSTAVLSSSTNPSNCIYLLSNNTWSSFNNATISSPGCAININYSADFNGGTITAPFIGYAGGNPNYGGTSFPEASPTKMLEVADPCQEIPGCAYLAANPPPATNCQTYNQNGHAGTIYPGCYQGLNLNAATTFAPGVYVISGNFNDNGATITGSGVTIYVPQGGNGPNFDNQSVQLSPPTSGNYANVLYYQVPSNSASINFNGPNVKMNGLIYAPGSNSVNFDGANGNYVVLVFGSANFNGNTAYEFASPSPGQAIVKQAVVTQ
jgi:hypothetical protein